MRATASFEAALESALQELARTGDVETCLRRYPGHAEQLRPLLETATTVRSHYRVLPPPAPAMLAAGRERFLSVAAQERARGASRAAETGTTVRTLRGRFRPALASKLLPIMLVALLGTVIFGGGIVWAASGSLPGELLYPVKLATEDVRLALASTPQRQVELVLDLVEERADEIQALAQAGGPVPDGPVLRLDQHIDRALVHTASASDEALPGLLLQVSERTGAQAQRLQQVQVTTAAPFQAGLQRAVAACWRGMQEAQAGLGDPQAFRWRHQHRQEEPESTQEPQQEQEQHQEQNREREGQPTHAPRVTPHGPQGSPGPEVTPRRVRVTTTPGLTVTLTLTSTPQGPRATAEPQPMPQGPRSTAGPQPTPQGPGSTAGPQPTSQGPGSTAGPQPTSQGPGSTAGPQPTSQGPGSTAGPQPPSQGPQSTAGPQPTPQGPQATAEPEATAVPPVQDLPATSQPGQPGGGPGGSP